MKKIRTNGENFVPQIKIRGNVLLLCIFCNSDRKASWKAGRQENGHKDRKAGRKADKKADRKAGKTAGRKADRKADA